jgi:glycosyltransferase involved in cell wall biosynthesis
MALPRITLVTPSYNQARFIGWTARSVFLQRYPELEYIMMDGGSTDDTMKVLEPYADRFAYVVSERDKGQSDAISRGFARSSGDIMAYLNSDDMLAPGTLHCVARYFQDHPDVDVVYSHRCTVDEHNRVLWYWLLPEHNDWYMMRWDLIPQETCFWRRRLFEKVGNVDPTFRFAMDYDLFFRFMHAAPGRTRRLNRFLGVFRQHDEAKTTRLMETVGAEEIRRVWKRYQIAPRWLDPYRSARFYHGVIRAGDRFAVKKGKLPGALPGVGYNYDQVWGGLLDDGRLPPEAGAVLTAAAV